MPGWKSLRYRLEAVLLGALVWAVPKLPRRLCVLLGQALGNLAFHLDGRGRAVGLANVECVFGDRFTPRVRREIVRRSYQNFARTMLDLFWAARLTPENYHRWFQTVGFAEARAHLAQEEAGGIFVTIHQGNWEWTSLLCALEQIPTLVVAAEFKNAHLAEIFRQARQRHGVNIIPQKNSLLRMLKSVRRNGFTGMLIDLNLRPSQAATVIDCFASREGGVPLRMCVPLLHAVLTQRAGTPLFPVESIPQPDGTCRIIIHPPLSIPQGATLQQISQVCWDFFEPLIQRRPETWLWPYKHFRYRPKQTSREYPPYANTSGDFERLLRQEKPAAAPSA